tara:strand:+ start:31 stop:828 length:798 start_codon:yes stop_codon:yes gene_type:complete
MGKKSTKKKKTSKYKNKTHKQSKISILDPPMAKSIHKGSMSTKSKDYEYQDSKVISTFLNALIKKHKSIRDGLCLYYNNPFLLQLKLPLHGIRDITLTSKSSISMDRLFDKIHACSTKDTLIPIFVFLKIEGQDKMHVNVVIIDSKRKNIELFEPHGYSSNKSELENVTRAYIKVSRHLQLFFKKQLPDYQFIRVNKYVKCSSFQGSIDAYGGMCNYWVLLYLHYRILNPRITSKQLIEYMHKRITKRILLRYSRFVEKIIKLKI